MQEIEQAIHTNSNSCVAISDIGWRPLVTNDSDTSKAARTASARSAASELSQSAATIPHATA